VESAKWSAVNCHPVSVLMVDAATAGCGCYIMVRIFNYFPGEFECRTVVKAGATVQQSKYVVRGPILHTPHRASQMHE